MVAESLDGEVGIRDEAGDAVGAGTGRHLCRAVEPDGLGLPARGNTRVAAGEDGLEQRVRPMGDDPHGQRIDDLAAIEIVEIPTVGAAVAGLLRLEGAIEGEGDVGGVHDVAIMKAHILAQAKFCDCGGETGPGGGQHGRVARDGRGDVDVDQRVGEAVEKLCGGV